MLLSVCAIYKWVGTVPVKCQTVIAMGPCLNGSDPGCTIMFVSVMGFSNIF